MAVLKSGEGDVLGNLLDLDVMAKFMEDALSESPDPDDSPPGGPSADVPAAPSVASPRSEFMKVTRLSAAVARALPRASAAFAAVTGRVMMK